MSRQRWKRHERDVAKLLGGERQPLTGRRSADVLTPQLAVEVKLRAVLPQWLHAAFCQAKESAGEKVPAVVLVESSRGSRSIRYIAFELETFIEHYIKEGDTNAVVCHTEVRADQEGSEERV